jgi:DNA-binding NtrC family response regulator
VAADRFRADLFYRLRVFTIHLPPLRERGDDVLLLVAHFLKVLNRALGKQVRSVAPEALRLLRDHDWPGNVRELHSALKYALVQAAGEVLTADCLPENVRGRPREPSAAAEPAGFDVAALVERLLQAGEPDIYRTVSLAVDRVVLGTVLRRVKGNQVQASELLGISRTTLRAKLRSLGLAVEKQLLSDAGPAE